MKPYYISDMKAIKIDETTYEKIRQLANINLRSMSKQAIFMLTEGVKIEEPVKPAYHHQQQRVKSQLH